MGIACAPSPHPGSNRTDPIRSEDTPLNRFWMALKALWLTWTDPEFAQRLEPLFRPATSRPDLRVLAVLQRDGRLIDFLAEDIDSYSDAQIGPAVRDIHRGLRKAFHDHPALQPGMNA